MTTTISNQPTTMQGTPSVTHPDEATGAIALIAATMDGHVSNEESAWIATILTKIAFPDEARIARFRTGLAAAAAILGSKGDVAAFVKASASLYQTHEQRVEALCVAASVVIEDGKLEEGEKIYMVYLGTLLGMPIELTKHALQESANFRAKRLAGK